jgi:hypothetical protein
VGERVEGERKSGARAGKAVERVEHSVILMSNQQDRVTYRL